MAYNSYLFDFVLEKMAYDYLPARISTITIHRVHGITLIFDINTYSKEIKPEPHHYDFEQALVCSILNNTSSEPNIRSLESIPPNNAVNIGVQIDGRYNRNITS